MIAAEEEEWEARLRKDRGEDVPGGAGGSGGGVGTFEEYREKSKAAGVM